MKGIDYSWARPTGAAIKAAGFDFVMRYVPFPGDQGKGLTVAELADLRANGLAVGLVFETTADRALAGADAGAADAKVCLAAQTLLGWPDSLPFYFAVDFDAQPAQFDAIDAYLRGAAGVLGGERVGVYGSYAVIEHCCWAKTASWLWQTYAWSSDRRFMVAHIYQYQNGQTLNGGAVDYNTAIDGDAGLWAAPAAAPAPTPASVDTSLVARVAALEAALGGPSAISAWNAKGNDLLAGFGNVQEQAQETANTVAGLSTPVAQLYADIGRALSQAGTAITQAGNARQGG